MTTEMTTTKFDRDSLNKLRMLADREDRSAPLQLKVLIDSAFRTNPVELTDQRFLADMMDAIVGNSETGVATDATVINAAAFTAAGRISWGEENVKIIGVLADSSRCDVDGNVLSA